MEFFNASINVLKMGVTGIGAVLGTWGIINLAEGYGGDNPSSKSQGAKQFVAGGIVALVGIVLIPLLGNIFTV